MEDPHKKKDIYNGIYKIIKIKIKIKIKEEKKK